MDPNTNREWRELAINLAGLALMCVAAVTVALCLGCNAQPEPTRRLKVDINTPHRRVQIDVKVPTQRP